MQFFFFLNPSILADFRLYLYKLYFIFSLLKFLIKFNSVSSPKANVFRL